MDRNLRFVLDSRPADKVSPQNFRLVEEPVPTPGPGSSWCATIICRSIPTCAAG